MRPLAALCTIVCTLVASPGAAGATPVLRPPNAQVETIFGYAVAAFGTRTLVGAPHTAVDGRARAGAAYLFDAATGALVHELLDPGRGVDNLFGHAVAGSGDRVLIGAPRTNVYGLPMAGAAYLFDTGEGRLLRVFYEPTPAANAEFGSTVALVDGQPLIGSPATAVGGAQASGCAYLFDAATGKVARTFSARPVAVAHEIFATAAADAGADLLFGAPHAEVAGATHAGAAYLLTRANGELVRRYTAPHTVAESQFGSAVASTATHVAIGAPLESDGAFAGAGAVYVYDRASGALARTLREPVDDRRDRWFGYALAAACGGLAVSALHASPDGRWLAGLVYVFDPATGALVRTLREPTPSARSAFGIALAAANGRLFVGAERARTDAMRGAVYAFDCDAAGGAP